MALDDNELLDLVNAKDEVVGKVYRRDFVRAAGHEPGYIRAVELFIRNDKGQFWIPTRTADKKIAPNGLDYSMGGHVGAGESYEEAAIREIKEELNLDLTPEDLEFVQKFSPASTPYFRTVYLYKSNQTPKYNPEDFQSAEWMTFAELDEKLKSGVPAKSSLQETVLALRGVWS